MSTSTVNKYVATGTLFHGRARAANAGDVVHSTAEDIEARGWGDLVQLVEEPEPEKEPGIKTIIADVGDDVDAARTALAAELEKPEDARRKTLVEALEGKIAKLTT